MYFDKWFSENKASKEYMDKYMEYFYSWTGWKQPSNLDPLSYRAWMRIQFDNLKK